jgi:hypothetical protein
MNPIRYRTLVKHCGHPIHAEESHLPLATYRKALRENRVVTVHSSFTSDAHHSFGEVGHHYVNVVTRLVFPKPLPVPFETVVLGTYHCIGF